MGIAQALTPFLCLFLLVASYLQWQQSALTDGLTTDVLYGAAAGAIRLAFGTNNPTWEQFSCLLINRGVPHNELASLEEFYNKARDEGDLTTMLMTKTFAPYTEYAVFNTWGPALERMVGSSLAMMWISNKGVPPSLAMKILDGTIWKSIDAPPSQVTVSDARGAATSQ